MAKSIYGIKPIAPNEPDPKLHLVFKVIQDIAHRHHIKMPQVGYYNSSETNAFATGPSKNNSMVAISTGLLEKMDAEEIEGVVGHEMAHILNGDMVTMTLMQGVLNTFVIFLARIL
jgi:heat shock protein HtpX